jgi:hypothetical protein
MSSPLKKRPFKVVQQEWRWQWQQEQQRHQEQQEQKEEQRQQRQQEQQEEPPKKKQKVEQNFDWSTISIHKVSYSSKLHFSSWSRKISTKVLQDYDFQLIQLPCYSWDGTQVSPLRFLTLGYFRESTDGFDIDIIGGEPTDDIPIFLRARDKMSKIVFDSDFLNTQNGIESRSFDSVIKDTSKFQAFIGSTPITKQLLKSIETYKASTNLPDCIQQLRCLQISKNKLQHQNVDEPLKYVLKSSKDTEMVLYYAQDSESKYPDPHFCECKDSIPTLDDFLKQVWFPKCNISKLNFPIQETVVSLKKYFLFDSETRTIKLKNPQFCIPDCEYNESISIKDEKYEIDVDIQPHQIRVNYELEKQILLSYIEIGDLVDLIYDYWNPEILIDHIMNMNHLFTFCESRFLHRGIWSQDLLFSNSRNFYVLEENDSNTFITNSTTETISIFIKTLSGHLKIVNVDKTDTIKQIKDKIKKLHKFSDNFRLIYKGSPLANNFTLEENNIVQHSILHVISSGR